MAERTIIDREGQFRGNIVAYGLYEPEGSQALLVNVTGKILEAFDFESGEWVDWRSADVEAYGAVSYVWRHLPETVHLSRFNGGELMVAELSIGLVWSSERQHLSRAIRLAGFKRPQWYRVDDGVLYLARSDGLYTDDRFIRPKMRLRTVTRTEDLTMCR